MAAETGSGKTLAYLLPLVQQLLVNPPSVPVGGLHGIKQALKKNRLASTGSDSHGVLEKMEGERVGFMGKWPRAIVLVPTRELCAQVVGMLAPLLKGTGIKAKELWGEVELADLITMHQGDIKSGLPSKNRPDIVVMTVKCLQFNLRSKYAKMLIAHVKWIVFDEADYLFAANQKAFDAILTPFRSRDKLLLNNINDMSSLIGTETVYIFAAATIPRSAAFNKYLARYISGTKNALEIIRGEKLHKIERRLKHSFRTMSNREEKLQAVKNLLKDPKRTILFCNTAQSAADLNRELEKFKPLVCCKLVDATERLANLILFQKGESNSMSVLLHF